MNQLSKKVITNLQIQIQLNQVSVTNTFSKNVILKKKGQDDENVLKIKTYCNPSLSETLKTLLISCLPFIISILS